MVVDIGFLKKDINLKLIFLIVVLVITIAIFTIVYQSKLENISTGYKNKSEQLAKITTKAISEEAKVYEISEIQEKIKKDKETLEIGYNELKTENQALERNNIILQDELSSIKFELEKTKSELNNKKNKFELLQTRFNQVEESLIKANDEISRLAARVRKLCSELRNAGGSDDEC